MDVADRKEFELTLTLHMATWQLKESSRRRRLALVMIAAILMLTACGDADESARQLPTVPTVATTTSAETAPAAPATGQPVTDVGEDRRAAPRILLRPADVQPFRLVRRRGTPRPTPSVAEASSCPPERTPAIPDRPAIEATRLPRSAGCRRPS
jgi:hypothetical protein